MEKQSFDSENLKYLFEANSQYDIHGNELVLIDLQIYKNELPNDIVLFKSLLVQGASLNDFNPVNFKDKCLWFLFSAADTKEQKERISAWVKDSLQEKNYKKEILNFFEIDDKE